MELSEFLQEKIFSAGELVSKHLIPIMSVLGVLPFWMSTTSYVKNTLKNYQRLVKQFGIGSSQTKANMFLRKLANAVNHQIAIATALKVAMTPSNLLRIASGKLSRSVLPREGKNVDIFHAENVTC
jgi:hypothetical protein